MSTISSGARTQITYIEEVTQGTTPGTPAMKILRTTTRNINMKKGSLESQEVRASRARKDYRHGMVSVDGQFGYELSLQSYDDMLAGLLGGTWTAVTMSGTPDLGVTAHTFTRSAGSFVSDGFKPGDVIRTTGFSNSVNNGTFFVTGVAAGALTVQETLTVEAATSGRTLVFPGKRLEHGTTLVTYTFERAYLDIDKYQVSPGCTINQGTFSITPEQIVGGQLTILGMGAESATMQDDSLDASPTAAPTTSPFSSFDGNLYEGGAAYAVCTGVELTVNNNRTLQGVIGSKISPEVFEGEFLVTGTFSGFVLSEAFYNKFVNETESSVYIKLDDLDGTNFMTIVMRRIKYTGNDTDPPRTGPNIAQAPFVALEDSYGVTLSIQRSNT